MLAIAGAGGSLGPTVVRRLAPTGAHLALAGRDAEPLEALASDAGVDGDVTSVDLLDQAATRAWADGIAERMGQVDGLLHLVGGWRGGASIEESPPEDWDFLASLLMDTLQNVTRAFAPHLLANGRGRFAIVSAAQAQAPTHTNAAYAAAKAAAEAWTLALAHRFRGTGATANIVVVGSIVSPEMREEDRDKDFSAFTPAESIADALAYLCSDAAAPMNGQRLTLRGAV